ncbi:MULTISPECIES: NADH-quinone oxidoreductase subunit N [unclassified Lentimonas]|uniref:NADH-quinone oxidoreductase subunit N n=1 Tax=unclassified Lentimonas TaxID=2630993 RepID=UPI001325174B|nr:MULTISPECIES: NADH-quinone oxidoreductase subunit N [unclassified Lentimonas]CAA6679011.1 NADH-ubiquinone oxidoreductase chain N (EC [Lentimonas sp. CC4]CAA6684248.1 NADH-ubiquinone oxidoreductase chain N (EC [Lentimonas sp. CC6]CAA7076378.1 NADH-ubiquinone oxidoreductase chain N (EC [Lentimonas sp. CC4]CAA7170957.1 NADH-ubiquinone oxidoreductase chain N (EC [Lentimonas sp. CC21]CAA7183492.1 NADH-ubiquinone oxidoreductase chain N (EC [Lentimonas sp. CC8]
MNELLAEFLRSFTATNDWAAILPEILMAVLALALLGAEMVLPRAKQGLIARLAIWGQVVILALAMSCVGTCSAGATTYFSGMIQQTDVTQIMRGFFLVCSILVCYLGKIYLSKQQLPRTEFFHLVIIIAASMMLLVQSVNFVMLFVALEAVTIAFYVLVAYCRTSPLSLEAGLKYLILGALSSSILLFGIVLLYGIAGNPEMALSSGNSLGFTELGAFIAAHPDNLLVRVGAILVVAGLCFKIGAVPFQIWVPDVYQGAPTPVTAYLAVASKAAGFIVLIQLLTGPFIGLRDFMIPVLSFIAAATILFGNFTAVGQRNVKRLMGLSGIAHAGYLLVGVVAALTVEWAVYAVIFYLVTYLLASFAVFGVMAHVADSEDANQELEDYENLARTRPFLGGVLTAGLGSLAGIPPLGGFIGKLFLFIAAYQAGLYGLLGISVLGVVISIYYYFGWIRVAYFSNPTEGDVEAAQPLCLCNRLVLGGLVVATVLVGLFPAVLPIIP